MAGKWAWLRGKFPRLPLDPKYDDVLAAARDTFREKSLSELVALYNAKKDAKDAKERELSEIDADIVALEQLIWSEMERQDIDSVKIGDYRFTRKPEPAARAEDKAALLEWALENMRDNLSLHPSTLTAIVKAALEANEDIPPGVTVNVRDTVSRTRT